ncbi:MAG: hypothetical protein EP346_10200 [Bacteroidetes bacterium]|uniref:Cell division protein ZapB n=1 Tax=Phaeocystidibacter marisrubri TaxID=1577780 RepID=A0A6L3ZKL6_9FLAO|nr:hypothetical protein [Phaeocystidibacter marisrubri]KAB2818005.1 hypothetical protein F8C82_06265 [Phaeocystidibacter marisrubri]TNE28122.1 MAG: hypothetical protein EP346_10200 [Bacteroidota bacterium]GGH72440.1 hypothetical protein GCM10011318_16390 [Phaeocystidibacter marisrubri]
MNQALQLSENVRRKLEQLLERYDALKAENAALKSALSEIKADNERLKVENGDLEEQLRQARMAGALRGSDEGAVEETKSTLAELVREIDKCIALLNA